MTEPTGTASPAAAAPGDGGAGDPGAVPAPAARAPLVLPAWVDPALRIAGAAVAVGLAAALAVYGAFLVPFRGFGVRLPVSLLLSLVSNPALVWFAFVVTGRRLAGLLPAATWCVVYLAAATRTSEGDLLLTGGNWVGLATLVSGPLTFAVGIYALVLRDLRGPQPRAGGAAPVPTVTGDPGAADGPSHTRAAPTGPGTPGAGSDGAARGRRGVRRQRRRPGSAPTRRR